MSTKDGQNEAEQGFNDSELLDIMQEIESLEREFASSDEVAESEDLSIAADNVKKTSLQDEIDQELAASPEVAEADEIAEVEEQAGAEQEVAQASDSEEEQAAESFEEESFEELDQAEREMEEEQCASDNVVSMTPKAAPAPKYTSSTSHSSAPMSFSAEGSMNLNLEFTLGGSIASLHVQGDEGVTFQMEGVTLTLHPEHGAQVTMANGVKFSVPLSTPNAAKKAA